MFNDDDDDDDNEEEEDLNVEKLKEQMGFKDGKDEEEEGKSWKDRFRRSKNTVM